MTYEKKPARSVLEEQIRATGLRKSVVAEKLDVSLNTLGRWISKKHQIPNDKLNQFVGICAAYGVKTSAEEIRRADGYPPVMGRPTSAPKEDRQIPQIPEPLPGEFPIWYRQDLAVIAQAGVTMTRVPVLGRTPLGEAWETEENIEAVEHVPTNYFKRNGLFALRGKGDSMNLAGISTGDTVILRRINMQEMKSGSICLVEVDGESTIKRLKVELRPDADGYEAVLYPESTNPVHKPRRLGDVIPNVMGVVVGLIKDASPAQQRNARAKSRK